MKRSAKLPSDNTIALTVAMEYVEPQRDGFIRAVIDAGASHGIFTEKMAEHFDIVYAFEPAPDNFAKLEARFADNTKVKSYRVALSDKVGYASLSGDKPRSRFLVEGDNVVVSTIDAYSFSAIELIKIDVEGAEFPVLRGARHTLRFWSPVLIIERSGYGKRFGYDDRDMEKWLRKIGYREVAHVRPDHIYAKVRDER